MCGEGVGNIELAGNGDLEVIQEGTPSMSVRVRPGTAFVQGDTVADQGMYFVYNDAFESVAITAADGTNDRIDIIVARVYDDEVTGATCLWALEVITGTPAASPVAPAVPDSALILAEVYVAAGDTAIQNAEITDRRVPYEACQQNQTGFIGAETFTTSGTFNIQDVLDAAFIPGTNNSPAVRDYWLKVTVTGGGGGGGHAVATGAGQNSAGGGGGAGATGIAWINSKTAYTATGDTLQGVAVTIGSGGSGATNGGNSSFGPFVTANGGNAGGSTPASASGSAVAGGEQNTVTFGSGVSTQLVIAGGSGERGTSIFDYTILTRGGSGGASFWGGGARDATNSASNGWGFGGGGARNGASVAQTNGFAGGSGVVVVEVYA